MDCIVIPDEESDEDKPLSSFSKRRSRTSLPDPPSSDPDKNREMNATPVLSSGLSEGSETEGDSSSSDYAPASRKKTRRNRVAKRKSPALPRLANTRRRPNAAALEPTLPLSFPRWPIALQPRIQLRDLLAHRDAFPPLLPPCDFSNDVFEPRFSVDAHSWSMFLDGDMLSYLPSIPNFVSQGFAAPPLLFFLHLLVDTAAPRSAVFQVWSCLTKLIAMEPSESTIDCDELDVGSNNNTTAENSSQATRQYTPLFVLTLEHLAMLHSTAQEMLFLLKEIQAGHLSTSAVSSTCPGSKCNRHGKPRAGVSFLEVMANVADNTAFTAAKDSSHSTEPLGCVSRSVGELLERGVIVLEIFRAVVQQFQTSCALVEPHSSPSQELNCSPATCRAAYLLSSKNTVVATMNASRFSDLIVLLQDVGDNAPSIPMFGCFSTNHFQQLVGSLIDCLWSFGLRPQQPSPSRKKTPVQRKRKVSAPTTRKGRSASKTRTSTSTKAPVDSSSSSSFPSSQVAASFASHLFRSSSGVRVATSPARNSTPSGALHKAASVPIKLEPTTSPSVTPSTAQSSDAAAASSDSSSSSVSSFTALVKRAFSFPLRFSLSGSPPTSDTISSSSNVSSSHSTPPLWSAVKSEPDAMETPVATGSDNTTHDSLLPQLQTPDAALPAAEPTRRTRKRAAPATKQKRKQSTARLIPKPRKRQKKAVTRRTITESPLVAPSIAEAPPLLEAAIEVDEDEDEDAPLTSFRRKRSLEPATCPPPPSRVPPAPLPVSLPPPLEAAMEVDDDEDEDAPPTIFRRKRAPEPATCAPPPSRSPSPSPPVSLPPSSAAAPLARRATVLDVLGLSSAALRAAPTAAPRSRSKELNGRGSLRSAPARGVHSIAHSARDRISKTTIEPASRVRVKLEHPSPADTEQELPTRASRSRAAKQRLFATPNKSDRADLSLVSTTADALLGDSTHPIVIGDSDDDEAGAATVSTIASSASTTATPASSFSSPPFTSSSVAGAARSAASPSSPFVLPSTISPHPLKPPSPADSSSMSSTPAPRLRTTSFLSPPTIPRDTAKLTPVTPNLFTPPPPRLHSASESVPVLSTLSNTKAPSRVGQRCNASPARSTSTSAVSSSPQEVSARARRPPMRGNASSTKSISPQRTTTPASRRIISSGGASRTINASDAPAALHFSTPSSLMKALSPARRDIIQRSPNHSTRPASDSRLVSICPNGLKASPPRSAVQRAAFFSSSSTLRPPPPSSPSPSTSLSTPNTHVSPTRPLPTSNTDPSSTRRPQNNVLSVLRSISSDATVPSVPNATKPVSNKPVRPNNVLSVLYKFS